MKKLVLFLCMLSTTAYAKIDCNKHPIYCHIKKLRPDMKYKKAMSLSNLFYKYARKHGIKNPIRSVAMAMQETSLRSISRSQNVIVFNKDVTKYEIVRGYSDICMFQFHVNTITSYKLDPIELKKDINYCVEQHFVLLKKKMRYCKHLESEAWTCYHSATPKLRKRYKEDVERYL